MDIRVKCKLQIYQMQLGNTNAHLSTQKLDQVLQSLSDLQYKQKQQIKNYLLSAKIMKALIRQNIVQEGSAQKKGVLILEGACLITKKVANGRIVFSQLTYLQLVNIEVFMYNRAHYSAIVHSSQMKYIQISEKMLSILFNYFKDSIMDRQKSRSLVVEQKIKQVEKANQKREKQQMVNRLSLPSIKYLSRQNNNTYSTDILQKKFNSPKKNVQEKQSSSKIGKSKSSKKMKKDFDLQPVINTQKSKRQKSIISTQTPSDRSEKIFKQQLKTIIKRKLIYQRKQLGVLKAYRNNQQQNKIVFEEIGNTAHPESNQIDQYFKI